MGTSFFHVTSLKAVCTKVQLSPFFHLAASRPAVVSGSAVAGIQQGHPHAWVSAETCVHTALCPSASPLSRALRLPPGQEPMPCHAKDAGLPSLGSLPRPHCALTFLLCGL